MIGLILKTLFKFFAPTFFGINTKKAVFKLLQKVPSEELSQQINDTRLNDVPTLLQFDLGDLSPLRLKRATKNSSKNFSFNLLELSFPKTSKLNPLILGLQSSISKSGKLYTPHA